MTKPIIVCPHCGETKPHHAHGLCQRCYRREWAQQPKRKEWQRAYSKKVWLERAGHPITCPSCGRSAIHYAHGLCRRCYMERYNRNPERKQQHAEKERENRRIYRDRYRAAERRRQETDHRKQWKRRYSHAYYEMHQDELKDYAKSYRRADTPRQTIYKQRRRNRVRGLEATLTPQEWQDILERHGHRCYYCGRSDLPLEMEHMTPASRNGGLTADNIVPSCGPCNRSKKTMTPEEFAEFLKAIGRRD